jgi:hypothetical protein
MLFDSLFKKPSCDLCVVHFYRGIDEEGHVRPFHRGILIVEEPTEHPNRGILYHVSLYGGRWWRYKRVANTDMAMDSDFAGSIKVGEVRKADVKLVDRILEGIDIAADLDYVFGGQEWTKDGVRRLAKSGFVDLDRLGGLYKALERLEVEYLSSPRS